MLTKENFIAEGMDPQEYEILLKLSDYNSKINQKITDLKNKSSFSREIIEQTFKREIVTMSGEYRAYLKSKFNGPLSLRARIRKNHKWTNLLIWTYS